MKATQQLHDLGQSLWLDNITRELLTSGTLRRYIKELTVTGLTSNPTIFDKAIKDGGFCDDAGAPQQRLLWASTGTKDPDASDTLYVEALAAPDTINTIPEKTLLAFADHGAVRSELPADGGDAEAQLDEFARAGVDIASLASDLQLEGTRSFTESWNDLLECIAANSAVLEKGAQSKGK
jgi:transaldolase